MKKIIDAIKGSNDIAVLAHISEDPDAIGSSFAMADALERMGKKVFVYVSEPVDDKLEYIMREHIVYSSDMQSEHDLCICLDCGDIDRLGDRISVFNNSEKTINIDHHYTNTEFADLNYVDGTAAATAQILYPLIKELTDINVYTAKCLYTAIATDTGCFKYSNTSASTMRIVADLLEYDINHADISKILFDTEEFAVMQLKAEVMKNIKTYYDGQLCVVEINSQLFEKYGVDEMSVGDFVNIPRRIKGCEVAVSLKKRSEKVKISFRSNGKINVAEKAVLLGGGGHKMAAGAAIDSDLESAEKTIVELFKDLF